MNENGPHEDSQLVLGDIEPHKHLLKFPPEDQVLYKIMRVEDFLRSINENYLHFNRVDSYADLDPHDGEQPPRDREISNRARLIKDPDSSAAVIYDGFRARTYSCCFSMENSDFIWKNHGKGGKKGKLCVEFRFGKLRETINQTLKPGNAAIEFDGKRCQQIFSVNYGIVEYID